MLKVIEIHGIVSEKGAAKAPKRGIVTLYSNTGNEIAKECMN